MKSKNGSIWEKAFECRSCFRKSPYVLECGLWSHLLYNYRDLWRWYSIYVIPTVCCARGVQNNPNNMCGDPCKNQDTYHYVFLYYILVFLLIISLSLLWAIGY